MSTAAPSGAGQAAQAPTGDVAAPANPTAVAPAGEPTPARQIKPIPPPPRLPGVLEDGPEDASTRPPDTRARDASGRFVAGEPSESKVVGKPKPSAVDVLERAAEQKMADGIPEPPPQPVEPFEVAGEKYESREKFEQSYKSLKGMFRPLASLARDLGGMDKIPAKFVEAAHSAQGWHGEAQRLAARVAELEAGAKAPAAQSQPATPAPEGIDWALYAEISKVANEAGTPEKAHQWLMEQNNAILQAEIARIREEALENPRRAAEEQAARAQTADTLVSAMAAHTNPDGSPAFPELRDGEQAHQIGALAAQMGMDPDYVLTEAGMITAVAVYRMARQMGVVSAPPAVPTPSPTPAPAPNLAAEAAATLDGGRALLPSAGSTRAMSPEVARLVQGLKNRELIRPGLGFEA